MVTTEQVIVCPPERGCDGLYLPLGERLSASGLDLLNYPLKSFQYITNQAFDFEYLYRDSLDCLLVISLDNPNLNIKSHWQQLSVESKR